MTYWIGWFLLSIALTFIIVIIQFQSIKKAFHFAKQQPNDFAINLLIVSATLAISFLVSHKLFLIGFVTFFWLFLAVMNAIITHLRGYPLVFSDIFLIKEALSLSAHYFKPWVIACIGLGMILLVKLGYEWYQFQSSVAMFDYLWAIGYVTIASFIFNRVKVRSSDEKEIERGFPFDMANSVYPYVFRKPGGYNEEAMNAISKNLVKTTCSKKSHTPQLILLQLESFFDPLTLNGIHFSQDPIPTFRKLMNQNQSGMMEVSTFGGGTAKTEFSVLTSMNAQLLKPGEIPHHSFLKHTPVASLASQLKHVGYQATLVHNYEGNFYNRHLAYRNLGFSRYIPIEYMSGVGQAHDLAHMDDHD
ncbi:MAG: sulfatase-like hydrolase/transferase, partial [Turicibacter sp.]|nr:sulfatase-like hydrolase/transferase [Turicibacter sp.]